MNALILAGGFGTRLRPVIGDAPKALVDLGGAALLDRLVARLRAVPDLERLVLVSNARHFPRFAAWREAAGATDVELLDDGADDVEVRRGAVGDLAFALRTLGTGAPALVLGSDFLLGFPLDDFAQGRGEDVRLGVRRNDDPEDLKRRGHPTIDGNGRVTAFVEKPGTPTGPWSATALYRLSPAALGRVAAYLEEGGDPDAPGHFIAWLVSRMRVAAWELPGPLLDVGNPDSLAEARAAVATDPDRFVVRDPGPRR